MTIETTSTENNPIQSLISVAKSDIGLRREENQDSFGIIENENFCVYIVADGMGGVQGGAIASKLAVETIRNELKPLSTVTMSDISRAIAKANSAIFEKGSTDVALTGMGTTVVMLTFTETKLLVASVGDSRAYRLRGQELTQLTEDHTLVNELVKAGSITEEQAGNHPVSHMLTRSLGPTPTVEIDCFETAEVPFRDDVYLLCSDGLYNMVHPEEAAEAIQTLSINDVPDELISFANLRGGSDNITVVVIKTGELYPATDREDTIADEDKEESQDGEDQTSEEKSEDAKPADEAVIPPRPEFVFKQEAEDLNGSAEAQTPAEEEEKDTTPEETSSRSLRGLTYALGLAGISAALTIAYVIGSHRSAPPLVMTRETPVVSAPPSVVNEIPIVASSSSSSVAMAVTSEPIAVAMSSSESVSTVSSSSTISEIATPVAAATEYEKVLAHRDALRARVTELDDKLSAFNQPISGKIAETLGNSLTKISELQRQADAVNSTIEKSSALLAKWSGIRKKLENQNPVDLAEELTDISPEIKAKQDAFQKATWAYLQEHEKSQQSSATPEEQKKVADLAQARSSSMEDLTNAIRSVAAQEVAKTDKAVGDATFKRDTLNNQIQSEREEVAYARTLVGGDSSAREQKRQELSNDLARTREELKQLSTLIPEESSSSSSVISKASEDAAIQ